MRLSGSIPRHLTYCTNVHPAESWAETWAALAGPVAEVKQRFCPDRTMGVGLRLSARACRELEVEGALTDLEPRLADLGLYVFTLNGFPYGAFHQTRVKEAVYLPDWRDPDRVGYTLSLARILAALVPEGAMGSISTVPGCFARGHEERGGPARMAENLIGVVAALARLERESGRFITLALEPEPCCFLETTDQAIAFFEAHLYAKSGVTALASQIGVSAGPAEAALRRHLGICLDTCHAAVEFERPLKALRRLIGAGIPVPKIQLSAALRLTPEPGALTELSAFADEVYLHQVVAKKPDGRLQRYLDLPEALADPRPPGDEWRVHFHVPVFERAFGVLGSTEDALSDLLSEAGPEELSPHLEVETYTFGVLPERYRSLSLSECIQRELGWALEKVSGGRALGSDG